MHRPRFDRNNLKSGRGEFVLGIVEGAQELQQLE